ncbi:hypothetical protein Efla_000554 [Eimeria flavescens]
MSVLHNELGRCVPGSVPASAVAVEIPMVGCVVENALALADKLKPVLYRVLGMVGGSCINHKVRRHSMWA